MNIFTTLLPQLDNKSPPMFPIISERIEVVGPGNNYSAGEF